MRTILPSMKAAVIAGLVAVIAVGGALGAFAATRTVETTVELEMDFWVDTKASTAFVLTRQEGEEWVTHDLAVELEPHAVVEGLLVSSTVTLVVPVRVEVEPEPLPPLLDPMPPGIPPLRPGEAPSGRGSCCTVRGMPEHRAARSAISRELRRVITYARTNAGLTHEGRITVNIAYQDAGLLVRYRDAFGEELAELPDECSFQRGTHLFFTPLCRTNTEAIAHEWLEYALQTPYLRARWVGVGTLDYYWTVYQTGEPPNLRQDRYRSAVFHQPATAFKEGRGHEDLMAAAALFAVERYGTWGDWVGFYGAVREGAEVHAAFEEAFGVSLLRFYADFEEWGEWQRTIMLATAYKSCEEASRFLRPRRPSEGGGFADYHVPLEWDDDGDGYVCEEYGLFHREEDLTCIVVGSE